MNQDTVKAYLTQLKEKYNVSLYTPYKYFDGLKTRYQVRQRFLEMMERKYTTNYEAYRTDDSRRPTKESVYTTTFFRRYGRSHTSLPSKSEATGVPLDIIRTVYRRGMAAWKGGHRPGASQQQWAYARVHSFLVLGCTVIGPDFDLFERACDEMSLYNLRKWLSYPVECPKKTLTSSAYFQKRSENYEYIKYIARIINNNKR